MTTQYKLLLNDVCTFTPLEKKEGDSADIKRFQIIIKNPKNLMAYEIWNPNTPKANAGTSKIFGISPSLLVECIYHYNKKVKEVDGFIYKPTAWAALGNIAERGKNSGGVLVLDEFLFGADTKSPNEPIMTINAYTKSISELEGVVPFPEEPFTGNIRMNINSFQSTAMIGLLNDEFVEDWLKPTYNKINPYPYIGKEITENQDNDESQPSLMITMIVDGDLPGGQPKFVELLVTRDIINLSLYGIGSANNGTPPKEEFTFPSQVLAVPAGTIITLASNADKYAEVFGNPPTFTTSAVNVNGNDQLNLYYKGVRIDVFGDDNTDGTGEFWEYTNGYAYRKVLGPSTNFIKSDWVFGKGLLVGQSASELAVTLRSLPRWNKPAPGMTLSNRTEPKFSFLYSGKVSIKNISSGISRITVTNPLQALAYLIWDPNTPFTNKNSLPNGALVPLNNIYSIFSSSEIKVTEKGLPQDEYAWRPVATFDLIDETGKGITYVGRIVNMESEFGEPNQSPKIMIDVDTRNFELYKNKRLSALPNGDFFVVMDIDSWDSFWHHVGDTIRSVVTSKVFEKTSLNLISDLS